MKHSVLCMGVISLLLAACGGNQPGVDLGKPTPSQPTPTASATKSGSRILIAEHAGQDEEHALNEACVPFDPNDEAVKDGSVSGLVALKRAYGDELVIGKDNEGSSALCTLLGFGAGGCRFNRGKWVHYIVRDGKKVRATDDPTAYRVRAGEIDAWLWVKRGTKPYGLGTDFEEICDYLLGGRGLNKVQALASRG